MKAEKRKLRIGAREFVWTARIEYAPGVDQRRIRLCVWGSSKNGRMLEVILLSKSPPGPWGACTDTVFSTPRDVRAVIDHALLLGWEPETTGGRYILPHNEHVPPLELPDFTVSRPALVWRLWYCIVTNSYLSFCHSPSTSMLQ